MGRGSQLFYGFKQQHGLGLMEVLMALFLFSSAALGYAVLQSQAMSNMNRSMMRLQGLMILSESSERIRANSQLQDFSVYQEHFNATGRIAIMDCLHSNGCSAEQVAQNDVANLKQQAISQGFRLGMIDCPIVNGSFQSKCLVVAWRETIVGSQGSINNEEGHEPGDLTRCLKADGSYVNQADCVFVEIN